MSAQDEVREMVIELAKFTDEGREEYLTDLFNTFPSQNKVRGWHDNEAYFADVVGSAKCVALGHKPFEELDETSSEDGYSPAADHGPSWDGEELCLSTKYGIACSYCEGECDYGYGQLPDIWKMASSKGEVSE